RSIGQCFPICVMWNVYALATHLLPGAENEERVLWAFEMSSMQRYSLKIPIQAWIRGEEVELPFGLSRKRPSWPRNRSFDDSGTKRSVSLLDQASTSQSPNPNPN